MRMFSHQSATWYLLFIFELRRDRSYFVLTVNIFFKFLLMPILTPMVSNCLALLQQCLRVSTCDTVHVNVCVDTNTR